MGRVVIGIDPGTSGAIATLDIDTGWLEVRDVPYFQVRVGKTMRKRVDIPSTLALLNDNGEDVVQGVFFEKVGPQPRDGSASAFAFGEAVGALKACVVAARLPLFDVTPQEWKKHFKLSGKKGTDAADEARMIAGQRSPESAHYFRRKCDHNRADAVLIAHYGKSAYGAQLGVA